MIEKLNVEILVSNDQLIEKVCDFRIIENTIMVL